MTTLLLAMILATAPDGVAKAQQDIATAARLQAECLSPKECTIADEMLAAARAELVAAMALADVSPRPRHARGPSDDLWQRGDRRANPFEPDYVEAFEDVDPVPAPVEAQAAFEIAETQNNLDQLARP